MEADEPMSHQQRASQVYGHLGGLSPAVDRCLSDPAMSSKEKDDYTRTGRLGAVTAGDRRATPRAV